MYLKMFYSFFATDFNTRKYRNLIKNGRIALVVDSYRSVGNKAICVQDRTTIIDRGKEFSRIYKIFHRNSWVGIDPWKEGEASFIELSPITRYT
jgi:hypothetical protein